MIAHSKNEAKALGLKTYQGPKCSKGHSGIRRVSGHCIDCMSIRTSAHYKRDREKRIEQIRDWVSNNSIRHKQNRSNWAKENRHIEAANSAKRRFLGRKAANLLTEESRQELHNFYKNCPEGYVVDHVIPLQGKLVCGLHVPWNLQYLTHIDNCKKGNRILSL